jgi:hypothetical protein
MMRKILFIVWCFLAFSWVAWGQGVHVVRKNHGVVLSWTGAAHATQYKIYRSLDGITFGILATVPASVTSYYDASTSNGSSYYYQVTTYDTNYLSDGFTGPESGPSNTQSILVVK